MITLTNDQRAHLQQIVNGNVAGAYFAANILLQLAEGRDREFVARACFCTLDEIARIEQQFEQGGLEAIASFRG